MTLVFEQMQVARPTADEVAADYRQLEADWDAATTPAARADGEGIEVNVAGNLQARRMSAALWSPDSNRLVFAALYAESFADIFMVNQDGTDLRDAVRLPLGFQGR